MVSIWHPYVFSSKRTKTRVMGAVDTDYDDVIARLDGSGHPRRREFALNAIKGSLTVTVMKRAWEDCGIDYDDPRDVQQTYLADEGVVIIDLNGGDHVE